MASDLSWQTPLLPRTTRANAQTAHMVMLDPSGRAAWPDASNVSLHQIRSSKGTEMTRLSLAFLIAACLMSHAFAVDLPESEVEQFDYKTMSQANAWIGMCVAEAIPANSVAHAILSEQKTKLRLGGDARERSESSLREIASKLFDDLYRRAGPFEKWSRLAEEVEFARLTIVTKKGDIYFVDVLQKVGSSESSAFIVRGAGFTLRTPVIPHGKE